MAKANDISTDESEQLKALAEELERFDGEPLSDEEVDELLAKALANRLKKEAEIECQTTLHQEYLDQEIKHYIRQFVVNSRIEAKNHAEHQLFNLNARGVEWFRATSGSVLFLDEKNQELCSVLPAEVNTFGVRRRISINDNGIVAHVARTRKSHCSNNVNSVSFYQNEIASTNSEMAVPLFDGTDRKRLIGVYNLEANEGGAFTPIQVEEMQEKAAYLTPHLLVLERLSTHPEAFGWHPEVHTWGPATPLRKFCGIVSQQLRLEPDASPPSCSVWHFDSSKSELWALAVHGYDYKFINDEWLPLDSATGRVATKPTRTIASGSPAELNFIRLNKANRMNIDHVMLASLRSRDPQTTTGIGALAIHFSANRPEGQVPSEETLQWLAEQAEEIIETVSESRLRLAPSYLQNKFADSGFSSRDFDALMKVTLEKLGAEAGSIFVRAQGSRRLQCVFTTGLEGVTDIDRVAYDIDDDQDSCTCHLAIHGGTYRNNRGINRLRINGEFTAQHWREKLSGDAGLFRRVLGTSVQIGDPANPDMTIVLRLNRSSFSKPFTESDERLLKLILEHSKWVFENWAFMQIGREGFVEGTIKHVQVERLFEQIVAPAKARYEAPDQATLFVRCDDTTPPYRSHLYRSRKTNVPPEYLDDFSLTEQTGKEPVEALAEHKIVEGKVQHSPFLSRVCFPLLAWSGSQLVDGVVALDFQEEEEAWEECSRVGRFTDIVRLAAAWSVVDRDLNRQFLWGDAFEALTAWGTHLLSSEHGVNAFVNWARFELFDEKLLPNPLEFGDVEQKRPAYQELRNRLLQRYQVQATADGSRCKIPLRVGPCLVGCIELGLKNDGLSPGTEGHRYDDLLRELSASISSVWNRLMIDTNLWKVSFTETHSANDWKAWNANIRWISDNWRSRNTPSLLHGSRWT